MKTSPRLLPRIAIAFAVMWLVRDLTADLYLMPAATELIAPFRAPLSTSAPAAGDDWQVTLKELDGRLRPGENVSIRAGDRDVDGTKFLWWSSYWLFPHRVHLLAPDEAPASPILVVATSGGAATAPEGYFQVVFSRTWPGGAVRAYRRG